MILLGIGLGILVGVVFTTWVSGVKPSEPPPDDY